MVYILLYLALGLLWSGWLEWYCCGNLEEPYNYPFSVKERLVHIFFWPFTFGSFLFTIVKDCLK